MRGEVVQDECRACRRMLSSLVRRVDARRPGEGFLALSQLLGSAHEMPDSVACDGFLRSQCEANIRPMWSWSG